MPETPAEVDYRCFNAFRKGKRAKRNAGGEALHAFQCLEKVLKPEKRRK